jgi:hypothetical protein
MPRGGDRRRDRRHPALTLPHFWPRSGNRAGLSFVALRAGGTLASLGTLPNQGGDETLGPPPSPFLASKSATIAGGWDGRGAHADIPAPSGAILARARKPGNRSRKTDPTSRDGCDPGSRSGYTRGNGERAVVASAGEKGSLKGPDPRVGNAPHVPNFPQYVTNKFVNVAGLAAPSGTDERFIP